MSTLAWVLSDVLTFVILPIVILGVLRLPWDILSALWRLLRR